MTLRELFKLIADAIREKTGETGEIIAKDFPEKIAAIEVGSGSGSGSGDGGPIVTFVSDFPFTNGKTMFSVNTVEGKLTEIPELAEFDGFFDYFMDGGATYSSLKSASSKFNLSLTTVFESDKILITKTAAAKYIIFDVRDEDEGKVYFINDAGEQVSNLTTQRLKQNQSIAYGNIEIPEMVTTNNYKVVGWTSSEYSDRLLGPGCLIGPNTSYAYGNSNLTMIPNLIDDSDTNIMHIVLKAINYGNGLTINYSSDIWWEPSRSNYLTSAVKGFEGSIPSPDWQSGNVPSGTIGGFSEIHVYIDKTGTLAFRDLFGLGEQWMSWGDVHIFSDPEGMNEVKYLSYDFTTSYPLDSDMFSFLQDGQTYYIEGNVSEWA